MLKYKVNKKNAFRLAYVIEQNEEHFDMRFWYNNEDEKILEGINSKNLHEKIHTCGTTACIAGWAVALDPSCIVGHSLYPTFDASADKFLLKDEEHLCGVYFEAFKSHRQAVNMLRYLALTGTVDWDAQLTPLQVLYARIRGAINI